MKIKKYLHMLSTLLLIFSVSDSSAEENTYLGKFSQGSLDNWVVKEFSGRTQYNIVTDDEEKNKLVLKAVSNNSASGLFMKRKIDLSKTPYLHWSWKTDKLYKNLDEAKKHGDDFVARVYIVVDGGLFFWKTQALNYVWSSSFQQGQNWPNPFTANATMFAIESGKRNLGQWLYYSRDVQQDLKNLIGQQVRYIDAVAIMTDSDNTGQQATTYYGDIYFSTRP